MTKRFLAMLLILALMLPCMPLGATAQTVSNEEITDAAYDRADDVFAQLDQLETVHATKSATQSQRTDAAQALVEASEGYVTGSLVRNGDAFTWMTTDGIRCTYNPRLRKINDSMTAPESAEPDGIYNEPVSVKGGWPSSNQVYLIGPYYGYDSDFTDQYKNEAKRIATAIGDTDGYTLYSGKAATVDKVAEAVSKGAVVFFDSHGTTDYESGYDYVTGATSSYLCLTSTTGLTSADYDDGALYYSDGICINGATIANHMTSNSPGGILWMAICLGMATNTMCNPLREKGVEVVCGYSQSVTFAGDYLFEDAFWDKMTEGQTVAQASSYMKSTWGSWDWSTKIANYYGYSDGYATISAARLDYAAFPVVVSDEDTHPGQRNRNTYYGADSLQTVKSTYTLYSQYTVTATSSNTAHGTVSVSGSTITAKPATGYTAQGYTLLSGSATVTQNGNTFSVQASSDCTVQINFAPKAKVTVSFQGAETSSITGYSGDAITLPTASAPEGYTFLGWTKEPLTEDTTTKPTCLTGSFTPTANTTLYALYSYTEEDAGTGTGDYVKVTSTPSDWSGQYVIVYEGSQRIFDGSLTSFDKVSNYKAVTITNNTIPAAQGDAYSFTITASGTGYAIQGTSGKYIGHASNTNGLTTGSSALVNRLSIGADGSANIIGTGGAYLRFNNNSGQYRFRYYKSSTYTSQKAICLYQKDGTGSTIWYTSQAGSCQHPEVTDGICAGCGFAFTAQTANGYWTSVQEAVDNAADGYVKLLKDAEESVTATALTLDLNGHLLEQITVSAALYAYDTSATAEKAGTGGILSVIGPVAPEYTTGGNRYIALENEGIYTFHVLQLQIDTVTLRTAQAGLYYQASVSCDDTLRTAISHYGIALSVQDMPGIDYKESHNLYTDTAGAPVSGQAFSSVMVTDIFRADAADNDARGRMPVYANAYLELSDGTVLLSDNTTCDTVGSGFDGVAMSLYDMMLALNAGYAALSATQKSTLQAFCTTWKAAMSDWKLSELTAA